MADRRDIWYLKPSVLNYKTKYHRYYIIHKNCTRGGGIQYVLMGLIAQNAKLKFQNT